MKELLVSVILTSYNSNEKYLHEAIQSVLNQSYRNIEFIIVDDGSTNKTIDNIKKYVDFSKIKLIKQKNFGLCNARNTGIKNSLGSYIAFLDDDDIWLDSKVEKCINAMNIQKKKDPNIGLVFSDSIVINELGEDKGVLGFRVEGNIYKKILGKNIIGPPSSVFIKKSVLDDVGYFDPEFIYAEDIELWYRLTQKYSVFSIDEPLIKYRYRNNSLSKNFRKMGIYTEKALLKNINKSITTVEREKVLSKYYYDFACLYFSVNDKEYYRKYLKNARDHDKKRIVNIKHMLGLVVSLGGVNAMKLFNQIRKKNVEIPSSYMKICDMR